MPVGIVGLHWLIHMHPPSLPRLWLLLGNSLFFLFLFLIIICFFDALPPKTNKQVCFLLFLLFKLLKTTSVLEGEVRRKVVCSHTGRSGSCFVFLAVLCKWTEGLTLRCLWRYNTTEPRVGSPGTPWPAGLAQSPSVQLFRELQSYNLLPWLRLKQTHACSGM